MFLKISTAAAALIAATAIAGAASAQDQSSAPADQSAPAAAAPADANAAPAATAPATDTTGYNVGTPQTDPNTGAQIVTNGPVPDTRANRSRFGTPDSHAGKRTSPAGN